jgi:hypothetical protein
MGKKGRLLWIALGVAAALVAGYYLLVLLLAQGIR